MTKIDEARNILEQLGLPPAQQNDISCLTLLALCNLSEGDAWGQATKPSLTIHQMLGFMRDTYGRDYAENTRETVRISLQPRRSTGNLSTPAANA